jgi:hypothetical protein
MEEHQIIKNLKTLRAIEPKNEWKNSFKSELFGLEAPRENNFFRGFLPSFNFKLAPVATFLAIMILFAGLLINFTKEESPETVQEIQKTQEPQSYLVLIETKLDGIKMPEDMFEVTDMMKKAEKEIDESADNPKESAETAQKVANISKKVKEIEERLGEGAKSLRDSANVLTSKTAEILEQNIQNTNQEIKNMVADEINEYETKTLNNPQLELFNQAKKYYNNNQFELALEKLFEIK